MHQLLIITLLFTVYTSTAQVYVARAGKIHFFSSSPIENIEATTTKAICMLNTSTKKVYCKMVMTSFTFRDKLMQEHFNENYMESDKFPNAVLEGVIQEAIPLEMDGMYEVTIKGSLEMHGVKQEREVKGKLTIAGGVPTLATAKFDVRLADHGIKIPSLVVANIAEVIAVDTELKFEKYEKK